MQSFTIEHPVSAPAEVLAQLPAQLLHVAAQFASKDPAKPAINVVHVLRIAETGRIKIEATNGHIAFRCYLPEAQPDDAAGGFWMQCNELFLSREAFAKRPPYSTLALIRADGEARLYGARKGAALSLQESRPLAGHPCECGTPFPNLDQVWPGEFNNAPGAPIGANADYLAVICKAISTYTENAVVRWACNCPTTPLHFEAATPDGVLMQFLLMPVQMRTTRPVGVLPEAWPD
jgi:hypothetical protein